MINRPFWLERIQFLWRHAPVVWLAGVRRVGKTTLSREVPDALYVNCDLPGNARSLVDPESFFREVQEPVVVFDEIHQLPDPARVLKIAADVFPRLRILATGSSTLAAGRKFRDTLTGRKRTMTLPPILLTELEAFGIRSLRERLFRGGLPPALLAKDRDEEFYAEWMDSYYARDIQELFRVEKRHGFLLLLECLFRQSGGLADFASLGRAANLSRPTVLNYLEIFQTTQTVRVLRPFHGGGRQEILHRPKVYGFDTGFVRYVNGWGDLREEDCGKLWEHLVLDLLSSRPGSRPVYFWRDKAGHEVDFVLPRDRGATSLVECQWTSEAFTPAGMLVFRALHPAGQNFVTAPDVKRKYEKRFGPLTVTFIPAESLILDEIEP